MPNFYGAHLKATTKRWCKGRRAPNHTLVVPQPTPKNPNSATERLPNSKDPPTPNKRSLSSLSAGGTQVSIFTKPLALSVFCVHEVGKDKCTKQHIIICMDIAIMQHSSNGKVCSAFGVRPADLLCLFPTPGLLKEAFCRETFSGVFIGEKRTATAYSHDFPPMR